MKTASLVSLVLLSSSFLAAQADEPPKAPKVDREVRGQLQFKSRRVEFDGTDLGQEDDTRKYIAGDPVSPQRAIWNFESIPKRILTAPNDIVRAKLTCSHFLLMKQAGPGALVFIRVVSHTCPQTPPDLAQKGEWQWADTATKGKARKEQYQADVTAYRAKKIDPDKLDEQGWKAANALAEKHGYFERCLPAMPELVETTIDLPAGLFRNALKNDRELNADDTPKRPLFSIYIKCESPGLMLGVKETDLRLVEDEQPKK